jgi:ketosteroid isomerase-like protein
MDISWETPLHPGGMATLAATEPADPADDVTAAADAILRAYRDGDDAAYLAAFAPDATFVLPGEPRRLDAADAYRARLRTLRVRHGYRVLAATSTNRHVRRYGDTAVLTHDLRTTATADDATRTTDERETIVFAYDTYGFRVAVHLHRSPLQG